jgi:hypothetical protein
MQNRKFRGHDTYGVFDGTRGAGKWQVMLNRSSIAAGLEIRRPTPLS